MAVARDGDSFMKMSFLLLVALAAAGCSSIDQAGRGSAGAQAVTSSHHIVYHPQVVSEFSDGETQFLQFTTTADSYALTAK